MKWTKERPSKNGYYWALLRDVVVYQPVLLDVLDGWAFVFGNENKVFVGIFSEFSDNPIPPSRRGE